MKKIIVMVLFSCLSGCASNSGVLPIGQDVYMVSRQAATGFSGSGTLKAEAISEAKIFCDSKRKELKIVSTNEAIPPYIFGNFPKAEVQFKCLTESELESQFKNTVDTPPKNKQDFSNDKSGSINVRIEGFSNEKKDGIQIDHREPSVPM